MENRPLPRERARAEGARVRVQVSANLETLTRRALIRRGFAAPKRVDLSQRERVPQSAANTSYMRARS